MRPRLSELAAVTLVVVGIGLVKATPPSEASERPIEELPKLQLGWNVDLTKFDEGTPQSERNVCLVESSDECQAGEQSEGIGGFKHLDGVAVGAGPSQDVYVADTVNARIQVFTPAGLFVEMFGWDVNRTKSGEAGRTQSEKDLCTAAEVETSHVECQPGQSAPEGPAGQVVGPTSLAVDQATGDLYVWDESLDRVDKFSGTGEFLLMIGRGVNDKGGNLCTSTEEKECKVGTVSAPGSTEPGAFKLAHDRGDLLAVGAKGTLYVGDEGRIQEFESDTHVRDLPIGGRTQALALGPAGELFVSTGQMEGELTSTIRKLEPGGPEVVTQCSEAAPTCWPLHLQPEAPAEVSHFFITALAVDSHGRIAVSTREEAQDSEGKVRVKVAGVLLRGSTGSRISSFPLTEKRTGVRQRPEALAFGSAETEGGFLLYGSVNDTEDVIGFTPVAIGELLATGARCSEGAELSSPELETDATVNCTLEGTVNPWNVSETTIHFMYGRTCSSLEGESPPQALPQSEVPTPVSTVVEGLRPNEAAFCYKIEGSDHNAQGLDSGPEPVITPLVAPKIVGQPQASFVHATTAVMYGELNPENAKSEYFFEYAPAGDGTLQAICPLGLRDHKPGECAGVGMTAPLRAECRKLGEALQCEYGKLGATLRADGLQPQTAYRFRLTAEDEGVAVDKVTGKPERRSSLEGASGVTEGVFETRPPPLPSATTGPATEVGTTSAVISGFANPGGTSGVYSLEVGIDNGAATRYGTVYSSSVEGDAPVYAAFAVHGLQPGTAYSYRIGVVDTGYGSAYSEPGSFETQGLPLLLTDPLAEPMLAVPVIRFPRPKSGSKPSRARELATALRACRKKAKKARRKCERKARLKYGSNTQRSRPKIGRK